MLYVALATLIAAALQPGHPCPEALRWRELDAACSAHCRASKDRYRVRVAAPVCVEAMRAGAAMSNCFPWRSR